MQRRRQIAVMLTIAVAVAGAIAVFMLTRSSFTPTRAQLSAFVESQAKANCLVQRTVYATHKELTAGYTAAVDRSGLSHKTLQQLQSYEDTHLDVRAAISARVKTLCS
jgi:hypothetical protein